jgi:hypothetical protein
MSSKFLAGSSLYELLLDRALCQRIHYEAIERAINGSHTDAVPSTVDLLRLRERARLFGREAYLYHPEAVERIFDGFSLEMYRTIVELYCSRLERSMNMVWKIVHALALGTGRASISYEAVWAVCLHLEEQRQRETTVALTQDSTDWSMLSLRLERENQHTEGTDHLILCLLDLAREAVLAFRVVDQEHVNEALGLVLYDALVGQRQPGRVPAGLSWRIPERLITQQELQHDCLKGCTRLGIPCETQQDLPVFFQTIQEGFKREVTNRGLKVDQWATLFDSYLHKAYGYSPLRICEERARVYDHLVGYNRDPAWQSPALRYFLPLHKCTVNTSLFKCSR